MTVSDAEIEAFNSALLKRGYMSSQIIDNGDLLIALQAAASARTAPIPTLPAEAGEVVERLREIARIYGIVRVRPTNTHQEEVATACVAAASLIERLSASAAEIRNAGLEEAATVADGYAGTPVETPTKPIDWAEHGERMSALRIAKKIRAIQSLPAPSPREVTVDDAMVERACAWKPISECPYSGEPFFAAIEVRNAYVKQFSHFDYSVLYMDEGRLHFYDDVETGWDANEYTLCLTFSPPPKPALESALRPPHTEG